LKSFSLLLLLAAFLFGCASLEVPTDMNVKRLSYELESFEFSGRVSFKQAGKGSSGNIQWQKKGVDTDITLSSPVGDTVATIQSVPGEVTLSLADKRQFRAEDAETLTKKILGYTVPLKELNQWVLGQPNPFSKAEQTLYPNGLMEKFVQDGWLVKYTAYAEVNGVQMPKRLVVQGRDLEIRLVIDQWKFDSK
jgi:outer membrane lipoprotein LolB